MPAILPLLLTLAAAGPALTPKVTAANWRTHPGIEASRAVYREVEEARGRGALRESVRRAEDECWEWYELRIATDTSSTARYFYREGGGQDSIARHAFYYDVRGTLRFALLAGGAVNDSTIETRIWFDERGKRLYSRDERTGPGWTWLNSDPTMLIRDPRAMFAKGTGTCKLLPPERARRP